MGTIQDREIHLSRLRENLAHWGKKHEGKRRTGRERQKDEAQLRALTGKIDKVTSQQGGLDYHRDR